MKPLECYSDIKKEELVKMKKNSEKETKDNLTNTDDTIKENGIKKDNKKDNSIDSLKKNTVKINVSKDSEFLKYKVVNDKKKNIKPKQREKEKDLDTKNKSLGWIDLLFIVGVVFVYLIYARDYVYKNFESSAVYINQLFLYIVPFLYALIRRTSIKKLYSIRCPHILDILAGLSLVFGVMCLDTCISYIMSKYVKIGYSQSVAKPEIAFETAILMFAIFPAICEELFYRGYVFGILKDKSNRLVAVILSSAIFGAFHLNLEQGLSAFVMGLFLAYVVSSTKSIFVVVGMHLINNAIYLCMVYYPKQFSYVPLVSKKIEKTTDFVYLFSFALIFIIPSVVICNVRCNKLEE